jgi:hypothetical protein
MFPDPHPNRLSAPSPADSGDWWLRIGSIILSVFLAAPVAIVHEQWARRQLPPQARGGAGRDTPEEKRIEIETALAFYGAVLVIGRGLYRLRGARRELDELTAWSVWFPVVAHLGIALWMLFVAPRGDGRGFDVRPSFIVAGLMLITALGDVSERLRDGRLTGRQIEAAVRDAVLNALLAAALMVALFAISLLVTMMLYWTILYWTAF